MERNDFTLSPMIIDTHCHLIDDAFQNDVDEVILNAQAAGIGKMILACCDENEYPRINEICRRYPNVLYPTVGIHPENIAMDVKSQFEALFNNINQSNINQMPKAVGEVGIDLHWDKSRLQDQLWLLEAQTQWALEHNLPLILHIRDAMTEFLELCQHSLYNIAQTQGQQLRGILHCYSGTAEEADKALQYGDFLFGIGGTVTYKKSLVPDVARRIGLSRIVLETDAPYLAPVPHRGHRNEPAYTADTCRALAEILGTTADEVAIQTTANAQRMLQI